MIELLIKHADFFTKAVAMILWPLLILAVVCLMVAAFFYIPFHKIAVPATKGEG